MTGYVRQSAADIVPTAVVRAAPINNEFNALRDAFSATAGHKHDGTTAEGVYVPLIADSTAKDKVVVDGTNHRVGVFVNVSDTSTEQVRIQDGAIIPVTTNDVDLGSSSVKFKDLHLAGTAAIPVANIGAGNITATDLTVTGTIDVTNTTINNVSTPTLSSHAATKGYVDTAISDLINGAPGTIDTLNEIAAALGDDPNFATTMTNALATKLALAGGTMSGDIAMGGNKVTGLGTPTTGSDATSKTYIDTLYGSTAAAAVSAAAALVSENNAAASYDAFDDRYLGSKTSAPSVDNDGGTLITGALYWNTTSSNLFVWSGSAWTSAAFTSGSFATTNSTNTFTANQVVSVTDNTNAALRITQLGTGNALLVEDAANPDSTPFAITADGRAVIGATSAVAPTSGITPWLQLQGTTSATSSIGAMRFSNDAVQPYYVFAKSRSATNGTFGTVVQSGDALGTILFNGDDGSATPIQAASINAAVDGTPGTNDMPGRLVFSTTADGASSPTERMRIDSAGTVQLSADYKENVVTANTSTAYTISLASGTVQVLTLTGNCTFTFPTAAAGKSFIMLLKQDGTGSRTVTWPAAVKWPSGTAPTITSTASKLDKYIFTSDGTNWYGSDAGKNYTV